MPLTVSPVSPPRLRADSRVLDVMGLVDSGATVNVLPSEVGLQLGMVWDDRRANIRLAGSLGQQPAMPVFMIAEIGDFAPVRLAFAWVQSPNTPSILGQTNFFMEFEVCFYRSSLEFEVKPRSSIEQV
jgi:hypothetical protein